MKQIDSSKLIEENLENIIVHVYTRFGYAEVDCKQFVDASTLESLDEQPEQENEE